MHKLLLLFLLLAARPTRATQDFEVVAQVPLPTSAATTRLLFDHTGLLWIGTSAGLYSYDGYAFHAYRGALHTPSLLPDNYIQSLCEDHRKGIWIGTNNGLARLDLPTGSLRHYHTKQTNQHIVYTLHTSREGTVWAGTDGGLLRYDAARDTFVSVKEVRQNVKAIEEDKDGSLFIGTWDQGLLRYSPKTGQTQRIPGTDPCVYALALDGKGRLWTGSWDHGITMLDRQLRPHLLAETEGKRVYALVRDERGQVRRAIAPTVALATDGRALFARASAYEGVEIVSTRPSPIQFRPTKGIVKINALRPPYLATERGLWRQDNEEPTELYPRSIVSSLVSHEDKLWAGLSYMGILQVNADGTTTLLNHHNMPALGEDAATAMLENADGSVWVGGWRTITHIKGAGRTLRISDYLKDNYNGKVCHLMQDRRGRVWATIRTGGILRIDDIDKRRVKVYAASPSSHAPLTTTATIEDHDGHIWAISQGAGLLRLNPKTDQFEIVGEDYGIPDEDIYAIARDRKGALWMSVMGSLIQLPYPYKKGQTARRYAVSTPTGIFRPIENAAYASPSELLFAGVGGYVSLSLDALYSGAALPATKSSSIVVSDLLLDGAPYLTLPEKARRALSPYTPAYTTTWTIPAAAQRAAIDFVLLNYAAGEGQHYAYLLEPYADKWVACAPGQHQAAFEHLRAGTYRLRLRATDAYGQWQEGESLTLRVLPHWWETWWAYVLYVLALVCAVYACVVVYRRRMREVGRMRIAKVFANITHELITPLSVVAIATEKDGSDIVRANIDRAIRLCRQMLEANKASEGSLRLRVAKGDLSAFAATLVENLRPLAEKKSQRLIFEEEGKARPVYFDSDKIDKILYNLLSNAIKYTPDGGIVRLLLSYAESDSVRLEVSDTGIGMTSDQMKHLYRRFTDGDYREMKTMGTGIGLALTRDLVRLHLGEIHAESQPGQGTTFTLTLPSKRGAYGASLSSSNVSADTPPHSAASPQPAVVAPKGDGGYKLLLVEDNADLLALMRDALSERYEVYTARNGQQALVLIDRQPLDIVVSDVMMPVMDGIALTQAIKGNTDTAVLPVILLTALTSPDGRDRAYLSGADDYLNKPFPMNALALRIDNIVRSRQTLREKYIQDTTEPQATAAASDPEALFLARATQVVMDHIRDPQFDRDAFASILCMSASSLYRRLRALTGQTVSQFINSVRLKEAIRMARRDPQATIAAIAEQVGYSTPQYFTRLFKQEYGMSLREYVAERT